MKKYIIALDHGTTSCRAILFNKNGQIVHTKGKAINQIYPKPGWVEHDPVEIWQSQLEVLRGVIKESGVSPESVSGIGITNHRESVVIWDKNSGKPVYNVILWQCRRTASICDDLKSKGLKDEIQFKTGLVIDAYFSGTKIKWILDNIPGIREKAEKGQLLAGTIDTWLVWNLTGGKVHVTDYTNASRTMLFNIRTLDWDEKLLFQLGITPRLLPKVVPSSFVVGYTEEGILGYSVPISGITGDQQAALFGQTCFGPGSAKNTYGTGCFILMNTGKTPILSKHNLLTTIAWDVGEGVEYALEGSVFNAGSSIQWLRDEIGLIKHAADTDSIAQGVKDTGGVYVVPAFTGLGAPYWDMYARGIITGITRGTTRGHIIRATLESIAYQSREVLEAMELDSGIKLKDLKVDGGASVNEFLMQFQSDILSVKVSRPQIVETTALGAAYMAGLAVGFWKDKDEIKKHWHCERVFIPKMDPAVREKLYSGWKRAVQRALD
ncbi:MAG: glycerol kinase GlpK [Mahellales bacterium]|jgi:glycerol kinase